MDYISIRCISINPDYSSVFSVYEKGGQYYKKEGSNYTPYTGNELAVYCSQGITTPYDNACREALQDPTAYCPATKNFPLSAEYEKTNVACGLTKTKFCIRKKTTLPAAPAATTEAPIYTVPTDVVAECPFKDIFVDFTGTYCLTLDSQGKSVLIPFTPFTPPIP